MARPIASGLTVWRILVRRELAILSATPLAVLFVIAFLLAQGFTSFYLASLLESGAASLTPVFAFHPWLLLFFAPAFGQRLLAEERRLGSLESLLTMPVPPAALVAAKFCAGWLVILFALALTFPLWLTLAYLGEPDHGQIAASYIGSGLVAGVFLAVASACSAACRSQVSAFVSAVALCFALTLAGWPVLLEALRGWLSAPLLESLAALAILPHYEKFTAGLLDLASLLIYGGHILFWLALAYVFASGSLPLRRLIVPVASLAVLAVSAMILADQLVRRQQWDLTQDKTHTITAGTQDILTGLAASAQPITLRFFFSSRALLPYASLHNYGRAARDLAYALAQAAGGKIQLDIIDPAPFSKDEERALAAGLQPIPLPSGEAAFLGFAASNRIGGYEAAAQLLPERRAYLEYDFARALAALGRTQKPKLGIVSNLPLDTGAAGLPAALAGQARPFLLYQYIQQRFAPEFLEHNFTGIPLSFAAVLIAHPRALSPTALYALDQYLMAGGRLAIFADPHSEISLLAASQTSQPVKGYRTRSDLAPLLEKWGILYDSGAVLADRQLAQEVLTYADPRSPAQLYPLWLTLAGAGINPAHAITSGLDFINLATTGTLTIAAAAAARAQPLLTSSADSQILPVAEVLARPSPQALLDRFSPSGARHILAASLSGPFASAFAKPPQEVKTAAKTNAHRQHSPDSAHIIFIADSDIFDDRFWARKQNLAGSEIITPFAGNGDFVLNALDYLAGAPGLIDLRARARRARPFSRIVAMEEEAAAQSAEEIAALEKIIAGLEADLADPAAFTPPRQREAQRALRLHRESLRAIQDRLRQDITRFYNILRFSNIALLPLILALAAVFWRLRRARRMKPAGENR